MLAPVKANRYSCAFVFTSMTIRSSQRSYSRSALELWFDRLTHSWEPHFSDSLLEAGREVYRQGEAKAVELDEETAIVYFKQNKIEHYICVEWRNNCPFVRSSTSEKQLGDFLGVAGLYEIEELVADEMAELAVLDDLEVAENDAEKQEVRLEKCAEPEPPARALEVHLSAHQEGVRLQAFWNSEKNSASTLAYDNLNNDLTERERELLIGLTSKARKAGFRQRQTRKDYILRDTTQIPHFLKNIVPVWRQKYLLVEDERLNIYALGERSIDVELSVNKGDRDKLELSCQFRLNGNMLNAEQSTRMLSRGRQTVMIPGVGMLRTSAQQSAWINDWRNFFDESGNGRVPTYMLFSLFGRNYLNLRVSSETSDWHKDLLSTPHVNGHLPDFLRPYQKKGVVWLQHLASKGCHPLLADEMGLGKTLQVLTVISEALKFGEMAAMPQLVVCPASVIPVWEAEARYFFPELKIKILKSGHDFVSHPDNCLWLASYTQLRRHKDHLDQIQFGYAVLDEAQFIKNPDAKVSQSCFTIKAICRLAITGTPLENRLLDLWTIFRFLMPGLLGSRKRLEEDSKTDLINIASRIQKQIEPFVLRRTKADVLSELPPKMEMALYCPLSALQQNEYRRLTDEGVGRLGNTLNDTLREQSMSLFALLTRLRQVCCDPALLPWMQAGYEHSGKLQTLKDKLAEIIFARRKTVIFSQFVSFLDRARATLAESYPNIPIYELTGQSRDRATPVKEFQSIEGPAIIFVSLKAGGTGITLHAADYVFLLDPWWNPAVEQQAIDRVHRIGQDKEVFIYRLITSGTVEERIELLKKEKSDLFDSTVGKISDLSDLGVHFQSLRELVSLSAEA